MKDRSSSPSLGVGGGRACLAGGATAQTSQTFDFPSSDSTVVGSVGFIDADEVGFFWSMQRGDRVSETFTFSGPSSINRAAS